MSEYLSSPFDAASGSYKLPPQYERLREAYSYGAWDAATLAANYNFNHEPLMVTFEQLEQEVIKLSYMPLIIELGSADMFCDPALSISKYAIEKGLVVMRESMVPYSLLEEMVPNAGGGKAAKKAKEAGAVKATDQAYKGQFQRILDESKKDKMTPARWWSKSAHQVHFLRLYEEFRKHVLENTLENEPALVWAPLRKVGEAAQAAGHLPPTFAAFLSEHGKGRPLANPQQQNGKAPRSGGGGRRERTVAQPEQGEFPSGPYAANWGTHSDLSDALFAGGDDDLFAEGASAKGNVSKKQFQTFQIAIAALQSAQKTTQEKLDGLLEKGNDEDNTEKWELQEVDQQMRTIMGQMGSVVAILTSSLDAKNPMLGAAHCVMDNIIGTMNNTYKWDNDRKRVVLESMRHQEPFRKALLALEKKPASGS